MHAFKAKDNIVCDNPSRDESTLVGIDNGVHDVSKSVGDSPGNDFVLDITEADRSEFFNMGGVLHFQ